jgi:hypothetical protein
MKRPAFQFYPGDWLRDTALRTCSIGARGLWIDMICFMHEGNPYGHLKVNQKVILSTNLAVMCGATLLDIEGWLGELSSAGVFEKTEDGTIYSRRMIRDEIIREARAAGGKLGGNPNLKDAEKVNHSTNLPSATEVNQNLTPSSSSSSSSSSSTSKTKQKKDAALSVVLPDFIPQKAWHGYVQMRKVAPTEYAVELIIKQLKKMHSEGQDVGAVLDQSTANSWTSLYPLKTQQGTQNGKHAAIAENNRRLNELIQQELAGNVAQGGLGTRIAQTPWDDLPK